MKQILPPLLTVLLSALPLTAAPAGPPAAWSNNCISCHGTDGAGHTRMGHMYRIFDLTDPKVQTSFTDDQAFDAVKNGLVLQGSTKMKPFKDKLSDDEIKTLVAYVRTLAKKSG